MPPINRWAMTGVPTRASRVGRVTLVRCADQMNDLVNDPIDELMFVSSPRSGRMKIAQQFIAGSWSGELIRVRETDD
jgi:hypothetical protein